MLTSTCTHMRTNQKEEKATNRTDFSVTCRKEEWGEGGGQGWGGAVGKISIFKYPLSLQLTHS